jgi:putative spermidine/putrescine transport system ATP-binding protein
MNELLNVDGVTKRYGDLVALHPTRFSLNAGELLAFVGPSGAGKTTLLKILASLERPDDGQIDLYETFDRSHPVILVFQDYLLFPHMTVFENVAFGLRARRGRRRIPRSEISRRVTTYLSHLDIADKAGAWPEQLSGGQKQRVALARALVTEPQLLLLDEPFANLDKNLKRSTARFIRNLQRELDVTMVIVSHDLEETVEIADRIGVIVDGRLCRIGPFRDVYDRPSSLEVAEMFGPVNTIPEEMYDMLTSIHLDTLTSSFLSSHSIHCRPESVRVSADPDGEGTIVDFRLRAGIVHYDVSIRGISVLASSATAGLQIDQRVTLAFEDVFCIPVDQKEVV